MEDIIQLDMFSSEDIENFDNDNKKSCRSYLWGLVSYAPVEKLKPLLDLATHYAYILHNSDKCKNNHWHILLAFEDETSFNKLNDIIYSCKPLQNVFKKPIKNKQGAYKYLTHNGWEEKYQYNEEDIESDNKNFWSCVKSSVKNGYNIICDMLEGLTYLELAKKYGRDFIINHNKYHEFAKIVSLEYKLKK